MKYSRAGRYRTIYFCALTIGCVEPGFGDRVGTGSPGAWRKSGDGPMGRCPDITPSDITP